MSAQIQTEVDTNRAIQALRLVDFDWCVRLRDVWIDNTSDVSTLHQTLRNELAEQLDALLNSPSASPLGWPLVGSGGTGKTHLLSFLRQETISRKGAFILVDMTDVRDFWETVLQGYVDSLQEIIGTETQQFVVLRRFLDGYFKDPVDKTLHALTTCSSKQLRTYISKILKYLAKKKGQPAVKHQDAIRAICCLNSDDFDTQSVGLSWLQGQTLDDDAKREFGFQASSQTPRKTVTSLSWYLSLIGPTVVAFDQLDPIVHQLQDIEASDTDSTEQNASRSIVQKITSGFSNLRELHWTFPVVACVESTWSLLPQCAMSTALDRFEPARLLNKPGAAEFVESVVEKRMAPAFQAADWSPPFSTWPFQSSALSQLANETPRVIFKKCEEKRREMLSSGNVWQVDRFDGTPPKPPKGKPDELQQLDERFEHFKSDVDMEWLLNDKFEDHRLAPLFVTAFKFLKIEQEHRIPDDVDAIVDHEFPGGANARPLHARLRLVFHSENGREEHYCVRGLEWANARAYQTRLKMAMTQSGIDRDLNFRNLTITRSGAVPTGKVTTALNEHFAQSGGAIYQIAEDELRVLDALRHLDEQGDSALQSWLKARTPVSNLTRFVRQIVRNSLLLDDGGEKKPNDLPKPTPPQPPQPPPPNPDVLLSLGDRVASYGVGDRISVPAKVLAKHAIVLGGAGSGKTVTVRRIVEEAALGGIPSIIIDCAQDMCTFDEERNEPSAHWHDDDPGKSRDFLQSTEQIIYTPGKTTGRPLSLEPIPDLIPLRDDPDELNSAVEMIRGALQSVVASGSSQKSKNKMGILTKSLQFFARRASPTTLENYIQLLDALPDAACLGIKKETDLAREMADSLKIEVASNPLLKSEGTPLDPAVLFGDDQPSDNVRISAISLIGLPSLEQQRSFINQLSMLLFSWIKKNPHPPGGRALRGLLVIDEARDFIPAVKASSCKDSMIRLAAQARKYKLGLVLATQHPKDIDTKIVGNCATQMFGRMSSPASLETATELLQNQGLQSPKLAKLETGQFYTNFPDGMLTAPALVQMPDSLTAGRLLTEEEILKKANR